MMSHKRRIFAPLADKIARVKSWPGVRKSDVDNALTVARYDGTLAGFEAESRDNHLLDIVVVVHRETLPATLLFARNRMLDQWRGRYTEWPEAFSGNVNADRVQRIPRATPFVPNHVALEVVDFGANWRSPRPPRIRDVQLAQAERLADMAVIYNAVQSPDWLEAMDDGSTVPYATLPGLLIKAAGVNRWDSTLVISRLDEEVTLGGRHISTRPFTDSMPTIRNYVRR